MSRSRTLRGVVLAVTTCGALAACSTHPGDAAVVGSQSISQDSLDDVATALCAAQSGSTQGPPQELASRAARQGALDVLISSSLSEQYADSLDVRADPEQLSTAIAANKATLDALPASERATFTDALTDFATGQLVLVQIGQKALTAAGGGAKQPSQQEALQAGQQLRDAWAAKNADVTVNPRYGSYTKGALVTTSGSLSVPVSTAAKAGATATPDTSWVTTLPASQKCS